MHKVKEFHKFNHSRNLQARTSSITIMHILLFLKSSGYSRNLDILCTWFNQIHIYMYNTTVCVCISLCINWYWLCELTVMIQKMKWEWKILLFSSSLIAFNNHRCEMIQDIHTVEIRFSISFLISESTRKNV